MEEIEIINNAVAEISNLQAKVYQLELQQDFLIHEFSNVRRILHAEKITSYDSYLLNMVAAVGRILEDEEGA